MATQVTQVTQDTISNAEIVAPGIDKTQPNLALRAIKAGMRTPSVKKVIMRITGDSAVIPEQTVDYVLRATASVLSEQRRFTGGLKDSLTPKALDVTPQDLNKTYSDFWSKKRTGG